MKFPQPLMLHATSSLLLPHPFILKDIFGIDINSTEDLLKVLYKVTESEVPVDNKTLNKVANGGGKWNTKQKVILPLIDALKEKTEDHIKDGIPDLSFYICMLKNLFIKPDQKSAEESLESTFEKLPNIDSKYIYQRASDFIGSLAIFSSDGATVNFLKERIVAQTNLEELLEKDTFCSLLKTNTLLDEESINNLYEAHSSSLSCPPIFATPLFMDFFYQLLACLEIDYKQHVLKDVEGHQRIIKKPGATTELFVESIKYDDSAIPFGRILLYIGKMLGKIQDNEALGYNALAQYIPDAVNSDLKPVDPKDEDAVKERAENNRKNKYRMLCAWKKLDPKKRKIPKDETLIRFFGAAMEGLDLTFKCNSV